MASKKSRSETPPATKMSKYTYTLPGGNILTFNTKAEVERIKYIYNLFLSPGIDGKVQKTNLDLGVQLTEDNPLLKAQPVVGGLLTEIKSIPTLEYDKKYKYNPEVGDVKKVAASNPHVSSIKPRPKKKAPVSTTPVKTWQGSPYTAEELQPQNIRYTFANIQAVDCPTCTGQAGKNIEVYDCDGNGPYWFPCAIYNGQTPTNSMIGTPVECTMGNDPYFTTCQTPCNIGPWIVAAVSGCNPLYQSCESLKDGILCPTPPCKLALETLVSDQISTEFFNSETVEEIPAPTPGVPYPVPDVEFASSPTVFPFDWDCASPHAYYDAGFIPLDAATNAATHPYSLASSVNTGHVWNMMEYHSAHHPHDVCQEHRYNCIPDTGAISTSCTAQDPNGDWWFVWQIVCFQPKRYGMDPATGYGGTNSSVLLYYNVWSEMVDALIAAGEYSGSNTDSFVTLWNAGVKIGHSAHLCFNCPVDPVQSVCKTAGQI